MSSFVAGIGRWTSLVSHYSAHARLKQTEPRTIEGKSVVGGEPVQGIRVGGRQVVESLVNRYKE